jgi:hypothetical protein
MKLNFYLLTIFHLTISSALLSQKEMKTKVFSFIPATNVKVNGMAAGLIINNSDIPSGSTLTIVNGLNFELIGLGTILPLVGSDPLIPFELEGKNIYPFLESLIVDAKKSKTYIINGLSVSPGGLAGPDIHLNGINISGLNTLTAQTNGFSAAILINMNKVMHGVSIACFNASLEQKGLQIGLTNTTNKLRGFQIGLWNTNEKRSLPFINWNF